MNIDRVCPACGSEYPEATQRGANDPSNRRCSDAFHDPFGPSYLKREIYEFARGSAQRGILYMAEAREIDILIDSVIAAARQKVGNEARSERDAWMRRFEKLRDALILGEAENARLRQALDLHHYGKPTNVTCAACGRVQDEKGRSCEVSR